MKKISLLILLLLWPTFTWALDIKSKNVILYNMNDDSVIYALNEEDVVPIASLTKIMTALVSLDYIEDLDAKVTMTSDMYKTLREENAYQAGFTLGEKVTYRDLLYGLLLPSGAEAAQALAISTAGSIDNFAKAMNAKAKELGLTNTSFANPVGLDNPNNYSTAKDVAELLKVALQNETFKAIFTASEYTTSNGKHTFKASKATSKIVKGLIDGSKTGFTYDAGLCFASIAHHNNVNYLLVTLGAPYNNRNNHYNDAKEIYTYYFNNFDERLVLKKDTNITDITLINDEVISYPVSIKEDIVKYMTINCDFKENYDGLTAITKEMKVGDKLGTFTVSCGDEVLYKEDVLVTPAMIIVIPPYYLIYLGIALIVLLFIMGLWLSHKRKKKKKRRG